MTRTVSHAPDVEDEDLLWELRRLLASSGGTIADVAHALERGGGEVDRKGRDLLAGEIPPFEEHVDEDDEDD
jgi:hypothetical protein